MAEQTRASLMQEFRDGERPSGVDFADLIESSLNKRDDGVSVDATDSTLVLARGLRLGDSNDNQAGTLRFNGGVPQFHDGTGFVPIAGGGGGAFQAVGGGTDVAYTGNGTVGIGNFGATASTYRFEVELGTNTGTAEQVRFGNGVIYRGTGAQAGSAYFSHASHADNNSFALRQRATGEVSVNAPVGAPMTFTHGGSSAGLRMTINSSGRVLIGTATELAGPSAVLHVGGRAVKNSGGDVWEFPSDVRLKDKVEDYQGGLAQILAIRPVKFQYNGKAGTLKGEECVGVIGQEIEKVLPETVTKTHAILDKQSGEVDDLRIYNSSSLTYALINAVKELTARVAVLEAALSAKDNGGDA